MAVMCAACVMAPLAAVDTGDTRSDRETQIHLANILCHIVKQNNEAVGTHLQPSSGVGDCYLHT